MINWVTKVNSYEAVALWRNYISFRLAACVSFQMLWSSERQNGCRQMVIVCVIKPCDYQSQNLLLITHTCNKSVWKNASYNSSMNGLISWNMRKWVLKTTKRLWWLEWFVVDMDIVIKALIRWHFLYIIYVKCVYYPFFNFPINDGHKFNVIFCNVVETLYLIKFHHIHY